MANNELENAVGLSDKVLAAPLVLAKNLEEVYNVAKKIADSKGVSDVIDKAATSTKKLKTETADLTKQTATLATTQSKVAAAITTQAAAEAKQVQVIKQLTAAAKDNQATSDKQLKTIVNARTVLDGARVSYAGLRTEQERMSKTGKDTLTTVQKTSDELGKLTDKADAGGSATANYSGKLVNLKKELKATQGEMLHIAETLGVDSQEYSNAAKRAGELADTLGDLKESTKAVSGEPIEQFAGSFDLFKGKLATLDLKGATSGIKGMATSVKGLTFKQASAGAGDFGKALGGLGKALLANPIFLLVAVILGIGFAIYALKDKIKVLTAAFDVVGQVLDYVVQKAKDFGDAIGATTFAVDDATVSIVKNLEKQREAFTQLYDDQLKRAEAAGKSTIELEKAKQQIIKQTTQQEIDRFNFQKKNGSELSKEQAEQLAEAVKLNHDAALELELIDARVKKEKDKANKEAALREQGDALKLSQFLINNEIATNKAIVDDDTKTFDARMDAADKIIDLTNKLAIEERNAALKEKNLSSAAKLLIEAEYQQKVTDGAREAEANRLKIIKDNQDKAKANNEEYVVSQIKAAEKAGQELQNQINTQLDDYKKSLIAKGVASDEIDKLIVKKQKSIADDLIRAEISTQEAILNIEGLSADERGAVEQKLFDLKMKLTDAYYDNLEHKEDDWAGKLGKFLAKYTGAYTDFANAVDGLTAAGTAKRLAALDEEQAANEEQKSALLEQYKDDKQRTDSINQQYEKKQQQIDEQRKKAQIKQAKLDKAIALSIGVIKLAGAIIAMLQVGPAGFVLAAVAAATGAVELATIAARPIPTAAKGIQGHKGGAILAGEKGHEVVEFPGGQLALTNNKPTLYDFPAGTNIYAHNSSRTMDTMATRNLPLARDRSRGPVIDTVGHNLIRALTSTVKNKKEFHGATGGYSIGSARTNYINSLRNG